MHFQVPSNSNGDNPIVPSAWRNTGLLINAQALESDRLQDGALLLSFCVTLTSYLTSLNISSSVKEG